MFIGIISYGDVDKAIEQFKRIYSPDNFYMIHYNKRDKKAKKNDFLRLKNYYSKFKNVIFYSKHKVFWGTRTIVGVQLEIMKYFLKHRNEQYLLIVDAKTSNIINIKEIEKIINKNGPNKNYYNFSGSVYKETFPTLYEVKNNYGECFYNKRWYKNTYPTNTSHFKLHLRLICIWEILTDKIVFKNFLKRSAPDFKEWFLSEYHSWRVEPMYWDLIASNKKRNMPKFLHEWKIIYNSLMSLFTVLNREQLSIMFSHKKELKKIFRYSKGILGPEEFIFATLFYNLVDNDESNSLNLLSYFDISDNDSINKLKKLRKNNKTILFNRRIDNYKIFNKEFPIV